MQSLISSRTRSRGGNSTNVTQQRITAKPAKTKPCPIGAKVRLETDRGRVQFSAEDGEVIEVQKCRRVVRFEDGSIRSCMLRELVVDDFEFDDSEEIVEEGQPSSSVGDYFQALLPESRATGACMSHDSACLIDPLEGLADDTLRIIRQNQSLLSN